MLVKLTKRAVEAALPHPGRQRILFDADLAGFGLRIAPGGVKTWIVQYRPIAGGAKAPVRRYKIGRADALDPDAARRKAKIVLGRVSDGADPQAERNASRDDRTVAELIDLYDREGTAQKTERTRRFDHGVLTRHVVTQLGNRTVSGITAADVERLRDAVDAGKTAADIKTGKRGVARVRGGRSAANRALDLFRSVLAFAVRRGIRPDNPASGVRKLPVNRGNDRYLSPAEVKRLGGTLAELDRESGENAAALAAIRLLILTGCRKSEILTLEWSHVDVARSCLRLPNSKTGAKVVPLGAAALAVLKRLPRWAGNPYVIAGRKKRGHFVGLQKVWSTVRQRAGLADVRIHDLRHSFASTGVSSGDSLYLVGKLLGHSKSSSTQRYAHLHDDPLQAAADRISATLAAQLAGKAGKSRPAPRRKGAPS